MTVFGPNSSTLKTLELSTLDGARRNDLRLIELDRLIISGQPIFYGAGDFKDIDVVEKFVKDHRPIHTGMLGVMMYAYVDPCTCCIPAHGSRYVFEDNADPDSVISLVSEAREKGDPFDLIFVSAELYDQAKELINAVSPETKFIVACDRESTFSASQLRSKNIPAIDDNDYLRCSPLNAVIALVVFDELMVAGV